MQNADRYQSLGTLCDEPNGLTCSFHVARQWNKAVEISPFPTFELAASAVKQNQISAFLVPGAYPKLSTFIMDRDLQVRETFISTIPSLVLVGREESMPQSVETVFYHPATTDLLPEIGIAYQTREPVMSNSVACKALLSCNDSAVAITNQLCAVFYQLHIYKLLRKGIKMPFICFVKAQTESMPLSLSDRTV